MPIRAPEGAPNVLFYVLDDVGFGHLEPFGGLVKAPQPADPDEIKHLVQLGVHTTAANRAMYLEWKQPGSYRPICAGMY